MVKVYTARRCPWCSRVKSWLQEKGIPFEEIVVDDNKEAALELIRITGQSAVPVVVYDGGYIVGFNEQALERTFLNMIQE